VQSSSQIITTNKPTSSFFTGRMPFLSPNQQCQRSLSVTLWYWDGTAELDKKNSPFDRDSFLVFWAQTALQNSNSNYPLIGDVKYMWDGTNLHFSTNVSDYLGNGIRNRRIVGMSH